MLVAGRPISQRIFQLSATAQPDATCANFRTKTDSQCIASSGVIPEPLLTHDRASEFILNQTEADNY